MYKVAIWLLFVPNSKELNKHIIHLNHIWVQNKQLIKKSQCVGS